MRLSAIPAITFVLGGMAMANHAANIGPDSSEFELDMTGWIIKGMVAIGLLAALEVFLFLKRQGSANG